ncbi:TIR domain [Branchiostoma belcheri]|nr:TIR domain [Branchiostoma belcheri]
MNRLCINLLSILKGDLKGRRLGPPTTEKKLKELRELAKQKARWKEMKKDSSHRTETSVPQALIWGWSLADNSFLTTSLSPSDWDGFRCFRNTIRKNLTHGYKDVRLSSRRGFFEVANLQGGCSELGPSSRRLVRDTWRRLSVKHDMTGNMAGLLVVLLLIYVSHGVAMDTAETGSTGGESSYHLELPFCECEQEIRTMLGCICRNLSGLANEEDRVKISEYLSADPQITIFLQITIFIVKCEQTSSTNISGLFDFLPASVKKLKINDCAQDYIGKEVFYGMRNVEDLTITIESNAVVQVVFGNYSDFFNDSRTPVKVDFHPELFQSTPQLQHLALTFLYLDEFPKALYQEITHNPLVCGCWLYELVSNLDVAKQGVLYTKTDFEHMECAFPDTLRGRKVVDLSPSELWCPKECYNRWYYCYCYENTGELFMQSDSQCQPELKTCPSECSCLYQGQLHSSTAPYNELVNCSHRNLSSIPDDISNVTTILHLEGNQLTVINQTVLPQLLMIRELYLNDNNISYVGDMAFNNFNSLQILRLDGNNISEINSKVFKSLSELRELYLNHSGVRYLAADTFQGLVNLRKLHLENNKFKTLPENLFSGLKLMLLGIHGNPLTCGCDVLWFANWLQRRTHLLPQGRNVSCVADGKVKRDILSLSAAQFDCDDLQAAQARTRLIIGLSLALVLVTIILVFVIVIVKRKEDIQVYLYASQHDLDVVLQDVLPALENREPPFRVCLHHRDFLPGVPIAENILNAVSASKRTIILLSNNFLESDWCQLEFQAAHAQMLQDRANRVIVILLDDIPAENAPADIQHYLKTNTYLKWGDERFWERLIYAMPRPRPHAQNEDGDRLAMVELDHNG